MRSSGTDHPPVAGNGTGASAVRPALHKHTRAGHRRRDEADQLREVRATQGMRPDDFNLNVATAKVEIDGQLQFIDNANLPRAMHSEEMIVDSLIQARRQGREVRLHQLLTERHPCMSCQRLLDRYFPDADVFWITRQGRQSGRRLMREYGVAGSP